MRATCTKLCFEGHCTAISFKAAPRGRQECALLVHGHLLAERQGVFFCAAGQPKRIATFASARVAIRRHTETLAIEIYDCNHALLRALATTQKIDAAHDERAAELVCAPVSSARRSRLTRASCASLLVADPTR